jgi:hypothetical protein
MGDASEGALLAAFPGKVEQFGWNRPAVSMARMARVVRHQPDLYLDLEGTGYLVEAIGCGQDGTLKFRADKVDTLPLWETIQPLLIWAWRSTTKVGYLVKWEDFRLLWWASARDNGLKAFNEGNLYAEVKHAALKDLDVRT